MFIAAVAVAAPLLMLPQLVLLLLSLGLRHLLSSSSSSFSLLNGEGPRAQMGPTDLHKAERAPAHSRIGAFLLLNASARAGERAHVYVSERVHAHAYPLLRAQRTSAHRGHRSAAHALLR